MTALKSKAPHAAVAWFFLLYFVILFAERLQSLLRSAAAGQLFMDVFEGAACFIVTLSLLSVALFLIGKIIFAIQKNAVGSWDLRAFTASTAEKPKASPPLSIYLLLV